eukprot:TRINITY_DN12000_c0_g1_i1.p2 TRINITY_DN12000_c0_g1~~TRINITY_DN12000_c0_g1_i1.p2  ORF type:complete len:335 (-),score=42.89 TRINITY_DN12000_c0_g1_i1:449-1453(-)
MGNRCSSESEVVDPILGERTESVNDALKDVQQPLEGAPKNYRASRRQPVSAEPTVVTGEPIEKKVVPKTDEACQRIKEAVKSSFLFSEMDEEQTQDVVMAMEERQVKAGEVIITEGEDGDNFYVIEHGIFHAIKGGAKQFTYDNKGSFGELALMYNCPRAASVEAETDGILWAVDRQTFRIIILGSMIQKRQQYDNILASIPLFSELSAERVASIADCLVKECYKPGDYILKEGEELTSDAKFYIVESGTIECYKTLEGEKKLVKTLNPGDYFGELALVSKVPRQADCIVKDHVKTLTMARDAFERLMGPVGEILTEGAKQYSTLDQNAINAGI